ncbi:MAG: adenine deaminase [Clostridiales bacterium]|nr:adenine deaminase [Clostridiales bacterium]
MKELIQVASGKQKADLVIKNVTVADVFNGRYFVGDVAICGGKFAGVGSYSGKTEIDGTGKYLLPSFYDTHLHFESVMIRPSEYLKAAVPRGVTALNADPHEIANVCGETGIKFMLDDVKGIPCDVHFMMPSCVPATPEDKSGCVLDAKDVKRLVEKYKLFGLGEMMNFPAVIGGDDDVTEKLSVCDIIDGHAPSVGGNALNAYLCGNILTDHECETVDEVLEKISKGMYVMIREGSQTKNLTANIKAVNKSNLRRFLFCTDDRNVEDLFEIGTIQNAVRMAVECGLSPIEAVTIASLNAFEAYGIKKHGAIAPDYSADFLLCSDNIGQKIDAVYYHGDRVAENGKPLFDVTPADASKLYGSVHIKSVTKKDFEFEFKAGMPAMRVFPNTVVTQTVYPKSRDGLNLMCCIERHSNSGMIGHCYVDGFNLKNGAIAQTVGHDAHNITVLGDNAGDMLLAVNGLGSDGGLVLVKDGKLIGKLPLEIAGLMTDGSAENALKIRAELFKALGDMDYNKQIEPFMLLSFLTLIVIPDAKLNHKGLFGVSEWKYLYKG